VQSASNTQSVAVSLPDHPILVEISGAGTAAASATAPNLAQETDIALLYQGALNRAPSASELSYWSGVLANNVSAADQSQGLVHSLAQTSGSFNGSLSIADGFLQSGEFQTLHGGLNTQGFVDQVYENALHRPADAAGAQFWEHLIDTGAMTKAMALVGIADSNEALKANAHTLPAS